MTNDAPDNGYVAWRSLRMTREEDAELRLSAAAYGYSISSYMRLCLFGRRQGTLITRRPTEVIEGLGNLLGELNKHGSNLNQIARAYNQDEQNEIGLTLYMQRCRPVVDALEALLSNKFRLIVDDSADALDTVVSANGRYAALSALHNKDGQN